MTDSIKIKKNVSEDNKQSVTQKTKEPDNEQTRTNDILQKKLENCKVEITEWKDKFIRLNADFKNFEKRMIEQQKLWVGIAQAEIFANLLTIVDNFERALAEHIKQVKNPEHQTWIEGFTLIYQSFITLLNKSGVKEITEHGTFNPIYHEALAQIDSPNHASETIVEIMQKGYFFKDKVLRPAKVSIAK